MKKKPGKLTLSRKTLANLGAADLGKKNGGVKTDNGNGCYSHNGCSGYCSEGCSYGCVSYYTCNGHTCNRPCGY